MKEIYNEIQRLMAENDTGALATLIGVTGSAPRHQGAKMVVRYDGGIVGTVGGGLLEGMVKKEAMAVMNTGIAKVFDFDLDSGQSKGMICGGAAKVYIEPLIPSPKLLIFGGGHISFALVKVAKLLGFALTVIDDRKEFANGVRFPEADETIACDYQEVFSRVKVDSNTYVVIVTRGHAHDQTVLEWAVTTNAAYVGMIGSRSKIDKTYDDLRAKGVSDRTLESVYAPIGLEINSETPEEIAVSIMAQIIKVKGAGQGKKRSVCPA